ncbi:hypothetical protein V9T40_003439 [Parthenolecanium corni]|uniref:Rac GTPase-activating protein 1 n=1 Tax=Parthenolecanium corni TaxID=536013 RepID=A0AAN9YAE3_9HEMI
MSECDSDSLPFEMDCLLAYIRQCSLNELVLDEKFCKFVQQSNVLSQRLANLLQEKAKLERAVAESTKENIAKTNKLNVAMTVVQHERRLRELASVQRDQAQAQFEQLCAQLPEHRAKEMQTRVMTRVLATASSNTDIDVTTDSTFFSTSVVPSSGVESDYSPPGAAAYRAKRCSRVPSKRTGFTPNKASSLRQSVELLNDTFSLATEASLVSSIASTLISEDSRKSAIFYSTILEYLKNRQHAFQRKTFVLGEQCSVCDLKVACGKRALVCSDCRCIAHEKCNQKVPKPCIPVNPTVTLHSKLRKSVHDYSPRFAPYVPAIIVHCVLQVEERGLATAGLYKVSTFDRTVEDLKHQYGKNRGIPNLAQVDVLAICQFLKDFLVSLKPALIAKELFENLLQIFEPVPASKVAFEMVVDAVNKLDPTSRDTLVFLVLHLQNVASAEAVNMSPRRLSKIFTPLLVDRYEKGLFQAEKRKCKLLEKFIELPSDYWKIIFVKDL